MDAILLIILSLCFGLIVGSFLNVIIVRYPKMLEWQWQKECREHLNQPTTEKHKPFNLSRPASHCPHCQKKIKAWHNIPLLSYLLLRGKCAYCHHKIAFIYPVVEILSAVVSVAVVLHFGLSLPALLALLFSWSLIVLSVIDYQHQILPDTITLSTLWIGLLGNAFFFYTTPTFAILGAIAGYLFLWVIAKLFFLIRKKEGLGHGDFKMLAMLGAWSGITMLLNALLTGVLIALFISLSLIMTKQLNKENPIPFGPYLAIGGWLTFMFGPTLTTWITRIINYV